MTQDSGLSYRIMSTQTEKTGGQTEEGSFAARAQSAADMLLKKNDNVPRVTFIFSMHDAESISQWM